MITGPSIPHLDHPFVGREKEIQEIESLLSQQQGSMSLISGKLFNLDGAGGVGKTSLAIEIVNRFKHLFKDGILPLKRADEITPVSFSMDLARLFYIEITEPPDNTQAQQVITAILRDKNACIILDNVISWDALRYMIPLETRCALIITTRDRDIYNHLRLAYRNYTMQEISLEKFTESEAIALFKAMLERKYSEKDHSIYLGIAGNLGYLPIALRQAISLMVYKPHYSASDLYDTLQKDNRLDLLRRGSTEEGMDSRAIEVVYELSSLSSNDTLREALEYSAICAPGPIPLTFLIQLSGKEKIKENLEELFTYSWLEKRIIDGSIHFELHQLVRELVFKKYGRRFSSHYLSTVNNLFTDESIHFSKKDQLISQLREACDQASLQEQDYLKDWMYDLYSYCTYRGHAQLYHSLLQKVEDNFSDDKWTIRGVYGYRALILRDWGKFDEAMKMHKKEEEIKEALGDRAGLAICWWNMGLIHKDRKNKKKTIELWEKSIKTIQSIGVHIKGIDEKKLKELRENMERDS